MSTNSQINSNKLFENIDSSIKLPTISSQIKSSKKYHAYNFNYNNDDYTMVLYSQLTFKIQQIICDLVINNMIPINKDLHP